MAATRLEAWAARRYAPATSQVRRIGVGGSGRRTSADAAGIVVVCGLAGSLVAALKPGTVVIPSAVADALGNVVECDPSLSSRLVRAARELGFEPSTLPLITLPLMATGSVREQWQSHGFGAADMESAHFAGAGTRLAVVRVIIDSPEQELSDEWIRPLTIVFRRSRWGEALRLALTAPQYALRAAQVVGRGLATLPSA